MAGLSHGLSGQPWAEAWLQARRDLGLGASEDRPLFLEEVAGAVPPPVDAAYAAEPRDRAATLWTPPSSAPSYQREAYAPGLV